MDIKLIMMICRVGELRKRWQAEGQIESSKFSELKETDVIYSANSKSGMIDNDGDLENEKINSMTQH